MIFLYISAAAMVLTAFLHSWFGEKRLLRPLLALDAGLLANPRVRRLIRSSWHFTSALMVLCAVVVAWPGTPAAPIAAIGAVWLAVGINSLVSSRGKRVGWAPLTVAGVCALAGAIG